MAQGVVDRRLRTWIVVTGGLAVAGYAAFAATTWRNPWRFTALTLGVESVAVFIVLCVVAVLDRWLGRDLTQSAPDRAPGAYVPPPTPPGERRAA